MLKPLGLALCLVLALPTARADEGDLARDWGAKAGLMYQDTVAGLQGTALPARYEDDLARFAVAADRLGAWIDATGRPHDLGCIFRGMADEAELQLGQLETPGARESALRRLTTLFYDAENLALAASYTDAGSDGAEGSAPASCPANSAAALQYLTEQP